MILHSSLNDGSSVVGMGQVETVTRRGEGGLKGAGEHLFSSYFHDKLKMR